MTAISGQDLARGIATLPYSRWLGLTLEDSGSGWVCLRLPFSNALVGDPATGILHGGAVSALMDSVCGAAVVIHPDAGIGTATLDLRIDYMRPAPKGEDILARAECIRVTRSIAFVSARAYFGEESATVATASAAFTVPDRMEAVAS